MERAVEHQISAKKRLRLVMPVVFLIILILLCMTYNSYISRGVHVILAVPFALRRLPGQGAGIQLLGGGVGGLLFHRLFGTAVQTGW